MGNYNRYHETTDPPACADQCSCLTRQHHGTPDRESKKTFALSCTYHAVHIAKPWTLVTGIYTHTYTQVDIALMLKLCTPLPWQPQSVQAIGVSQSRLSQ